MASDKRQRVKIGIKYTNMIYRHVCYVIYTNLWPFFACQKPSTANYQAPESKDLGIKLILASPDPFFLTKDKKQSCNARLAKIIDFKSF